MSEISINPAALHIVANVLKGNDQKSTEISNSSFGKEAPVVANVRSHDGVDGEKIMSSIEAQAATVASSKLIRSDANTALMAQANNLPSDVLDLLGD